MVSFGDYERYCKYVLCGEYLTYSPSACSCPRYLTLRRLITVLKRSVSPMSSDLWQERSIFSSILKAALPGPARVAIVTACRGKVMNA